MASRNGLGPSDHMRGRDEIHEEPDAWRSRLSGRKGGEKLDAVFAIFGEAFDQAAGAHIFFDVPERLQGNAQPFERPTVNHIAAGAR